MSCGLQALRRTAVEAAAIVVFGATGLAACGGSSGQSSYHVNVIVSQHSRALLKVGEEVRLGGIRVGEVSGIAAKPPTVCASIGCVPVELSLETSVRYRIHVDATVEVCPASASGGAFVQLTAGNPSQPILRAGYTVPLSRTAAKAVC
jgi:ABC-type transporter Mla subunit MlaD